MFPSITMDTRLYTPSSCKVSGPAGLVSTAQSWDHPVGGREDSFTHTNVNVIAKCVLDQGQPLNLSLVHIMQVSQEVSHGGCTTILSVVIIINWGCM